MDVVIIGAGGHGRVVLDILLTSKHYHVKGFLDGNKALHGQYVDGYPVLGDVTLLNELRSRGISGAIVAIGDNPTRKFYASVVGNHGIELVNAIHPTAALSHTVEIGSNVVIAAGAMVCPHVKVSDSAILNTGCIVEHECTVGQAAHICPGTKLAGHVTVGPAAFVGIGAVVIQGLTIGQGAVVGAGSVVLRDVPPFTTCVGQPARVVKYRPPAGPAVGQTSASSTGQQRLIGTTA
ncbi:MAG: putative acetyltransferase EpsM [Phycisphaerae bacterium]|nr:putative acetyltransferase EpsM [Phycisphaerae bacterium]